MNQVKRDRRVAAGDLLRFLERGNRLVVLTEPIANRDRNIRTEDGACASAGVSPPPIIDPGRIVVIDPIDISDGRKMHVKSEEVGGIERIIDLLPARGIGLLLPINAMPNQHKALAAVLRIVFNDCVGT